MGDKVKYIIYSLLDFGLTFGGTAAIIVYNYVTEDNSVGFKITLTGIILIITLLLTAKAIFEKHYRTKYDVLLQQLAEATYEADKKAISEAIDKHKLKNNIYQRLMILLPFVILYVVTWLGATSLDNLRGTIGIILASMGAGSVFNILKKPLAEQVSLNKIIKKRGKYV